MVRKPSSSDTFRDMLDTEYLTNLWLPSGTEAAGLGTLAHGTIRKARCQGHSRAWRIMVTSTSSLEFFSVAG